MGSCQSNPEAELEAARPKTPPFEERVSDDASRDKSRERQQTDVSSMENFMKQASVRSRQHSRSSIHAGSVSYVQRGDASPAMPLTVHALKQSDKTTKAARRPDNTSVRKVTDWQLSVSGSSPEAEKTAKRMKGRNLRAGSLDSSLYPIPEAPEVPVDSTGHLMPTSGMILSTSISSNYEPDVGVVCQHAHRWKGFKPHAIDFTDLYTRIGEDKVRYLLPISPFDSPSYRQLARRLVAKCHSAFPDRLSDKIEQRGVVIVDRVAAMKRHSELLSAWFIERLGGPILNAEMSALCQPEALKSATSSVKITQGDVNKFIEILCDSMKLVGIEDSESDLLLSFLSDLGRDLCNSGPGSGKTR